MTTEQISAIAAVATLLVIGASAIAAVIQLRHMRASNQLDAVLSLERDFRAPELQSAFKYVQSELPEKLRDSAYRRDLTELGFVDPLAHPEVVLCNWFNAMGTLLKHRLVTEETFMDLFGRLIAYYWGALGGVVALMRRKRGNAQYHDFEYLAIRAQHWVESHPHGMFPKNSHRSLPADVWAAEDALPGGAGGLEAQR